MDIMNAQFEKIKGLVNEYDEIKRFVSCLENDKNLIAVIQSDYDGPGLNYSTYSNEIKNIVISALKNRMTEISKQFN
jgi:hypothetical protein